MVWSRYVACSLFIVGMALGAGSCDTDECANGSEGCACKPDGDCDAGLACVSGACENLCPIPYRCNGDEEEAQTSWYLLEQCDPATGDFEVLHDCSAETADDGQDACRCVSFVATGCGDDRYYVACLGIDGYAECGGGIEYEVPAPPEGAGLDDCG